MSYEPEPEEYGRSDFEARNKTNVPGILLLIVGILNVLGALYFAFNGVVTLLDPQMAMAAAKQFNPQQEQQMKQLGWSMDQLVNATAIGYIILGAIGVIAAIIIIFGGVQMRNLRSYGLAVFASILALIPCISPMGCCVLGEVAGIWALVVLMNQDVKTAFR